MLLPLGDARRGPKRTLPITKATSVRPLMLTFSSAQLAALGSGPRAMTFLAPWRAKVYGWVVNACPKICHVPAPKALEDLKDNILARHWPATKTPTTSQFNCFYL